MTSPQDPGTGLAPRLGQPQRVRFLTLRVNPLRAAQTQGPHSGLPPSTPSDQQEPRTVSPANPTRHNPLPHPRTDSPPTATAPNRAARAFNIGLLVATQRSDDRTLPAEIRDRFGMRACLHVGNEATNDMILGKPAFADGGRATDLRYNIDRGTCVVNHGFATNTKYTIVRTHYVRAHDSETHTPDQITPIITRALHHMTATGRTVRAAPDNITDEPPPPDHLTDIHTVLHDQPRVRTQIVLTRLAELNPAVYEGWSFTDLKTALAHHGVAISKSHGNSVIRTHDISRALTHRSTNHNPNGAADAGN
jgi:DNA segregation ATPase FtsK/SpoIIIE, S-DNA-T family